MTKYTFALIIALPAFAGCTTSPDTASSTTSTKELVLFVDAEMADCVSVAPMKCLKVRESEDQPWNLYYGDIEGFEYTPGTHYTLLVEQVPVKNPPADGGSVRTTLVKILSEN